MKKINLLDEARKYLLQGISIIPIQGKIPAIKGWKEYQTRFPTNDELSLWFQQNNITGIAAITGEISDFCVVDIDDPTLLDKYDWPTVPRVRSGRGVHLYFKYPKGKKVKSKSGFVVGMDMKTDGGLINLPPSLHVMTGKYYEWENLFDREKLRELPAWILECFEEKIMEPSILKSRDIWKNYRPTFGNIFSGNYVTAEMVEAIKDSSDIRLVVEPHTEIKSTSGQRMVGLCPFHTEKTPSFTIFLKDNSYYCFGCGTGGDIINLTMRLKNYKFHQAVLWLQNHGYLDNTNTKL